MSFGIDLRLPAYQGQRTRKLGDDSKSQSAGRGSAHCGTTSPTSPGTTQSHPMRSSSSYIPCETAASLLPDTQASPPAIRRRNASSASDFTPHSCGATFSDTLAAAPILSMWYAKSRSAAA